MNILMTLNSGYAYPAAVMLASLFRHNEGRIRVYCLYRDLSGDAKDLLSGIVQQREGSSITFLYVEDSMAAKLSKFPTTEALTEECYFIILAQFLLPEEMERILYLDGDMIVNGSLRELYDMDFEGRYMVAAGQYHREIEGHLYRRGARPKHGECFNSGILLLNLPLLRRDITMDTYYHAAEEENYEFLNADQGLLNLVFFDKVLYVDTLRYNFRLNVYNRYLREGNSPLTDLPTVVHFVNHDYYRIGRGTKPWNCTLTPVEYALLTAADKMKTEYGMESWVQKNAEMYDLFWKYAKLAGVFAPLWEKMSAKKENLLREMLRGLADVSKAKAIRENIFTQITHGEFSLIGDKLRDFTYGELEKYIDILPPDTAIETIQHLHRENCRRLSRQEKIKVAFMVYSSAEWQCDRLYWLLEEDSKFEPIILISGYGHGTPETIKNTYLSTIRYFTKSKKSYRVRLGGWMGEMYKDAAYDADILVYITPFENHLPHNLNFSRRTLNQLAVHIPYGIYIAEKDIPYYAGSFYDQSIFKMCWIYFAESNIHQNMIGKSQRLCGYNIVMSGMPKMDSYFETSVKSVRCDRWKTTADTKLKIIWAPHFNMAKGMNSTFHENYKFFYEYATNHPEISWIVRPHPRMSVGVLEKKLFHDIEEYDAYLRAWDELPNAKVVLGGDYFDIFLSSDCMILDSMSFLSEYQYTHKPLLRLLPEECRPINAYGERLDKFLYKTRGNDYERIECFIEMVKSERDEMREKRERFFDEVLDYKKQNGKLASEFIYDTFKDSFQE